MTRKHLTLIIIGLTLLTAVIHVEHFAQHQMQTAQAAEADPITEFLPHTHAADDDAQHEAAAATALPMNALMLLNAVGYIGLLAVVISKHPMLDAHRRRVIYGMIAYTAATLLAWVFIGDRVFIAYVAKLAELLLIAALALLLQRLDQPELEAARLTIERA